MRLVAGLLAASLFGADPAIAREPILGFPLDCHLGKDCFILNFPDADPGKGAADYTCGSLSVDGYKGTDFALARGIESSITADVLAVAPGRIRRAGDGTSDVSLGGHAGQNSSGTCIDGIVIDHGGGWETHYCNLKQDSVAVTEGEAVRMGQKMGQIGASNQTEDRYLHLMVSRDGQPVDPFNPTGIVICGAPPSPEEQLWQNPMPHPTGSAK